MAIEIVDFPIQNAGSFHSYVNVYQRINIQNIPKPNHFLRSTLRRLRRRISRPNFLRQSPRRDVASDVQHRPPRAFGPAEATSWTGAEPAAAVDADATVGGELVNLAESIHYPLVMSK